LQKAEPKKTKFEVRVAVEPSTGNVFEDFGLKSPEEQLTNAELGQHICDVIALRKLTPAKAANLLGIDQLRVSALMRGKLEGFSIDRLLRFVNALGRDVEIVISPARQAEEGDIRVVSA
jgi:predicted XRE-type DNA-binding protein